MNFQCNKGLDCFFAKNDINCLTFKREQIRLYLKNPGDGEIQAYLNDIILLPYEKITEDLKNFEGEILCSRDSPAGALCLSRTKNKNKNAP